MFGLELHLLLLLVVNERSDLLLVHQHQLLLLVLPRVSGGVTDGKTPENISDTRKSMWREVKWREAKQRCCGGSEARSHGVGSCSENISGLTHLHVFLHPLIKILLLLLLFRRGFVLRIAQRLLKLLLARREG